MNRRNFLKSGAMLSVLPFMNLSEQENSELNFIREKLGINFLDWQKKEFINILNQNYTYYSKNRGCGNSYLLSACAAYFAIKYPKSKIVVLAPSYRQTKLIIEESAEILHKNIDLSHISYDKYTVELRNIEQLIMFGVPICNSDKLLCGCRANILLIDCMSNCPKDYLNNILAGTCTINTNPIQSMKAGKLIYRNPTKIIGCC